MLVDDKDVEEFLEWKRNRHTPLDEACKHIQKILVQPYARGFDAVMPVMAFRVLAEAILLIREEIK